MALPATGSQISINQIQIYYGYTSGTTRTMSALAASHLGITAGNTVYLSASFGGQ
jgi:hypothetical protein